MDKSEKILVTGAAGFIGSHICRSLLKRGYVEVYGVDDLSGGDLDNIKDCKENGLKFYNVDLSESEKTAKIIEDIKPEIIYHLASSAREGASFFDPIKITKTNYVAYINTIEHAIKYGFDKLILFSSMAIYGDQKSPFDEQMKIDPVDIYGINKAAMEQTTEMLAKVHDFRYTIIRPHNVYGPYQSLRDKFRNVFGIWMNEIMRDEPIYIYGNGEQLRAFSYIENSLDCYINAMKENCDGAIINLGGKTPISINTASKLVIKYMGMDDDTYTITHLPERYGEVKEAWCTWEKSTKLLGYKEKISLEDGIQNMANWAKQKGKQEWTTEKLTLWNAKAPQWWNE